MALSSGYLFALRLARIHHSLSSVSSDEHQAFADDFGTDLGISLLESFGADKAKGSPPWQTEEFLKVFAEALKDLASINGVDSIPTQLSRARILKTYHGLRSGCLLPPMEKDLRNPATFGESAHIHRSLKKFGLHLLPGHKVVSLRKALLEMDRRETLSPASQATTIARFIPSPLDWNLADLVEAILWCATPGDILQPTVLNFRQISKRILDHFGLENTSETKRSFEGFFRTVYFAAFDFAAPQVKFSDVCGPIPVPRRSQAPTCYREMKRTGGLALYPPAFLRSFEVQIEDLFLTELRVILNS